MRSVTMPGKGEGDAGNLSPRARNPAIVSLACHETEWSPTWRE